MTPERGNAQYMRGKEINEMPTNYDDRPVSFEILEEIGVLSTYSTGWAKELNLVSWNGGQPRYDIRDWDPQHRRMSRGITLQEQEMRTLVDSLRRRRNVAHSSRAPQATPPRPQEAPLGHMANRPPERTVNAPLEADAESSAPLEADPENTAPLETDPMQAGSGDMSVAEHLSDAEDLCADEVDEAEETEERF